MSGNGDLAGPDGPAGKAGPAPPGRRRRRVLSLAALVVAAILAILLGVSSGPSDVALGDVIGAFLARLGFLSPGAVSREDEQIVFLVRVPRVLLGVLAGYALSVSGAVMQGIFRNPLADPYLLGVASGATAGAAVAIAFDLHHKPFFVPAAALAGGAVAVAVVYRLSLTRIGRLSDYTLILSGIAMAAFFGSITSFVIYLSEGDQLQTIVFWMLGSLTKPLLEDLGAPFLIVAACGLAIHFLARDLNALALGDDMALHLGIDPDLLKKTLLALVTVMTATVVALAGVIGFVGLIVPHAVRLVIGPEHRLLLLASGIGGAVFLVLCDVAARTAASPQDIPVGIITAVIGAPVLIYLLCRPWARRPTGAAGDPP